MTWGYIYLESIKYPSQVGRYISARRSERCVDHSMYIGFSQSDMAGLAEHVCTTGHEAQFKQTTILWGKDGFGERLAFESLQFRLHPFKVSREVGLQLSWCWQCLLLIPMG